MMSPSRLFTITITVVLLMLSAVVHEVAHGWVAHLCGDDTAKEAGRLTLNPARHLDGFGSFILPILMELLGGFVFAYAKPVPYNPNRLKNPKRDEVLVALAGPASNILQACLGTGLFNLVWGAIERDPSLFSAGPMVFGYTPMTLILSLFSTYVWINLTLAFFNLLPFPPLDGSKVLCYFLKGETLRRYYQIQNYAMPILLVLLYALPKLGLDPIGAYLEFTAGGLYNLLMGV